MPVVKLLGDCSVGFQTVRHFFFAQADPYSNFDDELMAFGAMFGQDMDRIIHELIWFGLVPLTFRSFNLFMRPFVQTPWGFYHPAMIDGGVDCRTH